MAKSVRKTTNLLVTGANLASTRDVMFEQARKEAPRAQLKTLEQNTSDRFPWIIFSIESLSFINDPNPESQLWFVRQGETSLYLNFMAIKTKKLDKAFIEEWSAVFKASEVVRL